MLTITQTQNDDQKSPLELAIEEFNKLGHVGFEHLIAWEATLADPLDRLAFYDHITYEYLAPGSQKSITPPLFGYMRGQRINAMNAIRTSQTTDHLTGLSNKRGYEAGVESIMNRAERGFYTDGQKIALIFIDINDFKRVNDLHGHQFGDEVLRYVAEGIASCTRTTDLKARISGDEFVIMLDPMKSDDPYTTLRDITVRINAIVQRNVRYKHPGKSDNISISAGMSILGIDANDAKELLDHADKAMYHAKKNPVKVSGLGTELNLFVYQTGLEYVAKEDRKGRT